MRKLSKQSKLKLKQIAVEAVLSMSTKNISKVAKQYKLRRKTLSDWVNLCKKNGKKALAKDARGAKKYQNTLLTKSEENWIRKAIINKTPEQLQLPFMLWNRGSVQDLIKQKYYKIFCLIKSCTDPLFQSIKGSCNLKPNNHFKAFNQVEYDSTEASF